MMKKIVLFCLLLSFTFAGCGAYFNTFYNTRKLFNEARREREKRKQDKPTSVELKKYDQTIEKASKILEVYPNSKYVDDAVMILGECFYYKGEYVKAQRKFQELIKFFPKSNYYYPAKIWLAKTNIALDDYITAKLILNELLRTEKLKREVRDESQYLLADLLFKQQLYAEAEQEFAKAVAQAKDKKIKAHAYFELGECQIFNGKPDEAAKSFAAAVETDKDADFQFDARLNYARSLKLSRQYKDAVKECSALLDNDLYKRKYGFVKLEVADCIYRQGKDDLLDNPALTLEESQVQQALEEYKAIAVENKRTEVSAIAYFRMGEILENDFSDFAQAKEYYDKVKQEYPRADIVPEATRKSKDIGDLIRLGNLVKKAQGEQLISEKHQGHLLTDLEKLLLEYGNHPELRFMKKQRQLALAGGDPGVSEEEVKQRQLTELVRNKLQLAEIYYFQFGEIDSALAEYNEVITLFPGQPECAKALLSSAYIYETEYGNEAKADSLLRQIIADFPDSEQAQQARLRLHLPLQKNPEEEVKALFEQAEEDLFVHRNIEQAVREYRRISQQYPESVYAQKALYALGWIQENVNFDNESALAIYKEIADKYPDSPFTVRVSKKIASFEREKRKEQKKSEQLKVEDKESAKDEELLLQNRASQENAADKAKKANPATDADLVKKLIKRPAADPKKDVPEQKKKNTNSKPKQ